MATCKLPATVGTNCSPLSTAIGAAVKTTTLGTNVSASATAEAYYCVVLSTYSLSYAGPVTAPAPVTCKGVDPTNADAPGDYLTITVTYSFTPLLPSLSLLPAQTMTSTAWTRLG
jgi:hypothetical protein